MMRCANGSLERRDSSMIGRARNGRAPRACVIAASITVAAATAADQILFVNDHTLTDYRAAATNVQGAIPLFQQRGVYIDGTLHHAPTHPLAIAGNPFGEQWNAHADLGSIRLDTGTFVIDDVDLALPAPGFRWVIGRTYNVRQGDADSAYVDADSPQGVNWFQTSQPELVFYEAASDGDDAVYLVYGADRYIEFVRYFNPDTEVLSTDTFRAVNGAGGAIDWNEDEDGPDEWVYYDPNGYKITFLGIQGIDDDDIADIDHEGQLWKIEDPAGNIAHVGDDLGDGTDPVSALASGYDSGGRLLYAIDTANRRYVYGYTTLDSVSRLTSVTVQEWSGSAWVATGDKVEYDYYRNTIQGADDHGSPGDLRHVMVHVPMTVTTDVSYLRTYYRYYTAAWSESVRGNPHHIQYVFQSEGVRKWDYVEEGDSQLDTTINYAGPTFPGYFTAHITNDNLKPYASAYFEYEDDDPPTADMHRRITKAWFNGDCGCGASGDAGDHLFTYEANDDYSNGAGYDEEWATRTIVERPAVGGDEAWVTQYFDEVGQPTSRVISDGDPGGVGAPDHWATYVVRGDGGVGGDSKADGLLVTIYTPESIDAYDHDAGSNAEFDVGASGLVIDIDRLEGLSDPSGRVVGFPKAFNLLDAPAGNSDLAVSFPYQTNATVVEHAVDPDAAAPVTHVVPGGGCPYWPATYAEIEGGDIILHETDFYDDGGQTDPLAVEQLTITYPDVATGNNGSGSSNVESHYFSLDGTLAWSKSTDAKITFRGYTDGLLTQVIEDVNTSGSEPDGFESDGSDNEAHRTTTHTYDDRGRLDTTALPDGRVLKHNYSMLKDGRLVTLQYPKFDSGTGRYYGPVQYTVTNQAGAVEVSAVVALDDNGGEYTTDALSTHVDETDDDPILAIDGTSGFGGVAQMSVSVYNEPGVKLLESRAYFNVPGSGAGNATDNYDPTTFAYDDRGRQIRTVSPDGTITRIEFDVRDQAVERSVGTNDEFVGGTDNMIIIEMMVYDGGSAGGNGLLTTRTLDEDGNWGTAGDQRETNYTYNYKGQLLLQENPVAPHVFNEYNDDDELKAVGLYSSIAAISVTADTPSTEASGRIALTEYAYDEMHRVWKTTRRKIAQSNGAIVANQELETKLWFDSLGRVMKSVGDQRLKTRWDRLGRQTHQFILSTDNDTVYADAEDVAGDIVIEEHQTTYESDDSDNVIMTASIERLQNDTGGGETTDALDANADGGTPDPRKYTAADIKGRIQITSNWFDALDRITDTVAYGTFGIENGSGGPFDRDGLSVPSRSATALLTEYAYNPDGTLLSVFDPRNKETRYEYDDLGRQTKVIANYVNGTPGGGANDDEDQTILYEYTDGLLTEMTADMSSGDQVTTYAYGVTTGQSPASDITVNNLLRQVTYPDDAGGSRGFVTYAYNALGERAAMEDQATNLIEMIYDDGGRVVERAVTNLGSGFDGAVRRIDYAYDAFGRQTTVTQYNDPDTGEGTVLDQVKFTYDDFGPVSKFEQDHNSTVATGGTYLYDVEYAYERATAGRQTVRKSSFTQPDGNVLTYTYLNTSSLHDDELSRVTQVKDDTVVVARYDYNGMGTVVGVKYPEIDVRQYQYSGSTFPDLDRFNRPIKSEWTKEYGITGTTMFYNVDVTWDENSNVELAEDNVHAGRDVDYTIDNLNRLIKAEEGTWNGSSITTRTRQEIWTLTQTGNWDVFKLDLNGDNDFVDASELNDDRTHNVVNELTARDTDDNGTDNYTLVHDANGNLTDNNQAQKYVYDAFNRLVQIKNQSNTVIANYRYNGLNYRITCHQDTDADGVVDGDDITLHYVYDERWRIVGVYENDDAAGDPIEQFAPHNAGEDGFGGSSYIDDVIMRDRDTDGDGAVDDERVYYCQNWRHDVVAVIFSDGSMAEWDAYSAYGVPFGLPRGDANSDGTITFADVAQIQTWINGSAYDVRGDVDLDGDVDLTDKAAVQGTSTTLGRGNLSDIDNVLGYAGYVFDQRMTNKWHVRYRMLDSELGRWAQRDPWGYVLTASVYEYAPNNPLSWTDPFGLYPNGETGPIPVGPSPMPIDDGPVPVGPGRMPIDEPSTWPNRIRPSDLACLATSYDENWKDFCNRLQRKIGNVRKAIERARRNLRDNPRGLPERHPDDYYKPRESIEGHRPILEFHEENLRILEDLFNTYCKGGPTPQRLPVMPPRPRMRPLERWYPPTIPQIHPDFGPGGDPIIVPSPSPQPIPSRTPPASSAPIWSRFCNFLKAMPCPPIFVPEFLIDPTGRLRPRRGLPDIA